MQIIFIENVPISVFYSIQESWSFIGIMRAVKKEMSSEVSISLPQLQIGLSVSWKPCLNLCSRKWLKPSLDLVSNLTLLRLWQLKTLLPEGRINFKSLFLKMFQLSKLRIFRSNLFRSMTAEGKKEFRKKLYFTVNWEMLLVFLVLHLLTVTGRMLKRHFLENDFYNCFLYNIVSCTIFFFQGFSNLAY